MHININIINSIININISFNLFSLAIFSDFKSRSSNCFSKQIVVLLCLFT